MLKARASSPRKANAVTKKSNLGGRGRAVPRAHPSPPSPHLASPPHSHPPFPGTHSPTTANTSTCPAGLCGRPGGVSLPATLVFLKSAWPGAITATSRGSEMPAPPLPQGPALV